MDLLQTRKEKRLIWGALLIIALFVSPLFILGENAHIRVHDNLDSNLAWYKVLKESGEIFGSIGAVIPQIMNGSLSRNAFGTEWSGIVWLHSLFPTMLAYALSQSITRVFAFLGMYLLLRDHFLTKQEWAVIRVGAALTFALTPFWPSGMLSTLGMPLALWALLHIRKGRISWREYAVFTLLPLYSSIVLGMFFFLFAMGVLWLVDVIRKKKHRWAFLIALVYMGLIYMLVEYRLVHSFIFDDEPNSRDEYIHARLTLWRVVRLTFKNYMLGHTHVMTVHTLVILPLLLIAFFIVWKKGWWKQEKSFLFLFILNFLLSLWYAFWFYKGWEPLTLKFHFMNTFNFARFHFLRPLVIYVSFALALKILWQALSKWKSLIISVCVAAQLIVLIPFNEEIAFQSKPSVKEFYDVKLFSQIKEYIGLPEDQYRVASIGLHPAIAQFNGFYTLDSYNNFYPLSYKYEFRKIIENELAKNKTIRTYYDEWGGRCYLFADELGKHYMFKKSSKKKLKNLQLQTDVFKEMGGRYIFSAVPIINAKENQLVLEKEFTTKESVWKIYLYRVR
ncbi:DUF6044 family protein [Niallia sp. XMNu-256]|uniref:DUF6044 family protein n=1 Tax=Niallia sp. XMNu-256 TaxID=3082444 RepID=UPI0030D48888